MKLFTRRREREHSRLGAPPGTLLRGETQQHVHYELFRFTSGTLKESQGEGLPDTALLTEEETVSWLNITGVEDSALLEHIGREFGIHPVILEDIQNTVQRPKLEDYGETVFLTFRMLQWNDGMESEQISVILGPGYVISFQERPGDVFDPIRRRLRENKGRIRRSGADYLAYALLDTVVDTYFLILEKLDEKLEDLDARIENRNDPELMERLREVKFDLISLRRAVWPLREVTDRLQKQDIPMFGKGMPPYLRDLYDHVLRVIDTVEVLRETLASLTDTFHAAMSNDMNAVMKVLTIIATIFIPLTFIAGIYGMNFTHMPELSVPWAYPALLTFMAVLAGGMLIYFRWKRWL